MAGLRLTGGVARGRVVRGPLGPGVRPTSARVREALFSLVGQDLAGQTFLDAYGGSGLIGLEAWSRGARVTVVEKDRRASREIAERGSAVGADWVVLHGDITRRASSLGGFDVVFADPPYDTPPAAVLRLLAPLAGRVLVLEVDARTAVPAEAGGLRLDRERTYGRTGLCVYRP